MTETVRVGSEPTAIAVGEGAVWVGNGGDGTLVRIDAGTRRVSQTIEVGRSPSALAIARGSLWTTALASPESHRGGTLRLMWPPEGQLPCRCAEPLAYDSSQSWWLASLVYDGLVGYRRIGGAGGATLVGNLASEAPEPTPDGKTYVFKLRRGLRFSDGTAVGPEDFRHSLERLLRLNADEPSYLLRGHTRSPRMQDPPSQLRPLEGHRDRPHRTDDRDPPQGARRRVPPQAHAPAVGEDLGRAARSRSVATSLRCSAGSATRAPCAPSRPPLTSPPYSNHLHR